MENCEWLPELISCDDFARYSEYEEKIYQIFKKDFIDSYPSFEKMRVTIRYTPKIDGKENSFYHVICQDYYKNNNRQPDLRRCERIKWIRGFLENYKCKDTACVCLECEGIKVFEEPANAHHKKRLDLFLEEERYIVILEPRKTDFFLITAFYMDPSHDLDHTFRKKVKLYNESKKRLASETPSGTPSTTGR